MNPPDVGTFMHRVIEKFSTHMLDNKISYREIDKVWCDNTVDLIVDNILKEMKGSGISASRRYTVLASRLKRVVSRTLWTISEHIKRGGFEPVGFEIEFGNKGKYPPVNIELENGEHISLTGRVDRVDALETEEGKIIRVIDYKSGNKSFNLSDVYNGLNIQLPVYLDALINSSDNGNFIPGGILYLKIDDPLVSTFRNATEDEINTAITKQLKMKGLVLAEPDVIKKMDRDIKGYSDILPVRINIDGTLGKSSAASRAQFNILNRYLKSLISGLCTKMSNGDVSIKPYRIKNKTSCDYCSYLPVCQFEANLGGNDWKMLINFDDEQCWRFMEGNMLKNE
jgi:ATP-dependent helicase/nuclease subunit B